MFRQIEIKLKSENSINPEMHWAYHLYAALLEIMPTSYADEFHQNSISPINHYLILPKEKDEQAFTWLVNIWGKELIDDLTRVINKQEGLKIRAINTNLKIEEIKSGKIIKESDFIKQQITLEKPKNLYRIKLISPCTFKSNNEYALFPSVELIIKSAVQKWNTYARESILDDPQAINELIEHSRIVDYSLRSNRYKIKGNAIKSFSGNINISTRGTSAMQGLYSLLFNFLPYAGIGVKSGLGMGGCIIIP